jgi:hypothetical protein
VEVSSGIAWISILVASLAALYARWAAAAARRQNEIAIHNEKLKILKSFLDFRSKLSAYGTDVLERDLTLELYRHVQLAEFYYTAATSAELNKFYMSVSEMIGLRELARETKDRETLNKMNQQLVICRTSAKQVEDVMRTELRLINAG